MLLWGLVLAWLPALRRGAIQRALWTIFLLLAAVKTVALDPVVNWINGTSGVHDANTLVQHMIGIAAAITLLRFISLISGAYEQRPRAKAFQLGTGLMVAAGLVVFFTVTDDGVYSSADELLASPIAEPATIAYWMLLEAYLGVALTMGGLLLWRVSRAATNLLRVGLWLMCAGVALNALFAVYKSAYVLAHAAGVGMPTGTVVAISTNMLLVANLLMVAGVALPAWTAAAKVIEARRSMRALAPLWHTIRATFPEMILPVPRKLPTAEGILATVRLRLYRRLIEIRDGMLELRGYVPPGVTAEALAYLTDKGVGAEETAVLAEACWIEVALREVESGATGGNPGEMTAVPGGGSVEEEVAWLSRVSQAHSRSPYPAQFADWRTVTPASSRSPAPTP